MALIENHVQRAVWWCRFAFVIPEQGYPLALSQESRGDDESGQVMSPPGRLTRESGKANHAVDRRNERTKTSCRAKIDRENFDDLCVVCISLRSYVAGRRLPVSAAVAHRTFDSSGPFRIKALVSKVSIGRTAHVWHHRIHTHRPALRGAILHELACRVVQRQNAPYPRWVLLALPMHTHWFDLPFHLHDEWEYSFWMVRTSWVYPSSPYRMITRQHIPHPRMVQLTLSVSNHWFISPLTTWMNESRIDLCDSSRDVVMSRAHAHLPRSCPSSRPCTAYLLTSLLCARAGLAADLKRR